MADQWHVAWLKEGVERWNKRRKKIDFEPDLSGVRFFDFLPPDFRDLPKTSRYFEKINLSRANLSRADLSDLNFAGANFSESNLSHSDMSMSNFNRANFSESNLTDANLRRSMLLKANFKNADLKGAIFIEASADGALLAEDGVSSEQIGTLAAADFHASPRLLTQASAKKDGEATVGLPIARSKAEIDERKVKNKFDVYFGTSRRPIFKRGAIVDFDANLNSDVSYGVCEVIVPEGRRIGSIGSRWWKRFISKSDDRLRVDAMISLNSELFWTYHREIVERVRVPSKATIFVHGFNTTFEDAVLRAAQMGYDLGLGQGIGLFSWPSKGSFAAYSADEAICEASKYLLADFIKNFVENTPGDGINLIAHSMGCRCLMGAFEVLSSRSAHILKKIDQVILAAADIDSAIMPHLGCHSVEHCKRTTSYVSDRDKALKISGWLHKFPRIGITPPTFVLKGMDTIVVNDLDLGNLSHSYVASSRTVLADIFNLIKYNSAPTDRHGIEIASLGGTEYWRIKT